MGAEQWSIRLATAGDLSEVAAIFRTCFADSFLSVSGGTAIRDDALVDVLSFIHVEEPDAFCVAVSDAGRVAGYCVTPQSMPRLWRRALAGGHVGRWLARWVCGRYSLSLGAAAALAYDKLLFTVSPHNRVRGTAQVLSMAVSPDFRRRGLARALLSAGCEYLVGRGVGELKLEVRPWNTAAMRLYASMGFSAVGRAPDRRGGWIVMQRRLDTSGYQ